MTRITDEKLMELLEIFYKGLHRKPTEDYINEYVVRITNEILTDEENSFDDFIENYLNLPEMDEILKSAEISFFKTEFTKLVPVSLDAHQEELFTNFIRNKINTI